MRERTEKEDVLPDDWRDWPLAPVAAKKLGISVRQLGRFVSRGHLARYRAPDETYRYNPEELETAGDMFRPEADEDEGAPSAESLKNGNALVKQTHEQFARMFDKYSESYDVIMSRYREENESLRVRIRELETQRDDFVQKREAMLSEQYIRDSLNSQIVRKEARKDKAFGLVLDRLPGLMGKLEDAALGTSPQVKATIELLKGFDKESLEMLLQTEIVSPEQKAHIRTILGMPQEVPKTKSDEE